MGYYRKVDATLICKNIAKCLGSILLWPFGQIICPPQLRLTNNAFYFNIRKKNTTSILLYQNSGSSSIFFFLMPNLLISSEIDFVFGLNLESSILIDKFQVLFI